jgi:hypothetical protein
MTMLVRRVLALVLTLATMSAPLALALCHVDCADATSSRESAAHHSCHGTDEAAAVSMTAVPHMCGHDDGTPAGVERAQQIVTAPVAVMPPAAWAAPSKVERIVPVAVEHSPPRSLQLVSQLRV